LLANKNAKPVTMLVSLPGMLNLQVKIDYAGLNLMASSGESLEEIMGEMTF